MLTTTPKCPDCSNEVVSRGYRQGMGSRIQSFKCWRCRHQWPCPKSTLVAAVRTEQAVADSKIAERRGY